MAGNQNILSAKLEVRDSFSSQLNKFKNALNATETAFNKFVNRLDQSSTKVEKTLDRIDKKMIQVSTKMMSQNEKVANSIIKSTDKVEQKQKKAMDDLLTKYTKMGGDIQDIFKNVQKEADKLNKSGLRINIGGSSNKSSTTGSGHSHGHGGSGILGDNNTENVISSLLGGNLQMMSMHLGIIGGAIMGVSRILETINNWAQQGYNALNTLSTGLLSVDGLKEGIESAGQFEINRVAMNVLYGNDENKGQKYYKMGTYLAKETPYSEVEVGELQKKLAGVHVEYSEEDLMTLLDIASIKPELGADHVGFSIVSSMGGRSTSLKQNYMLDNKEINKYLQGLKKSDESKDRTNYKKWKDSFTKTGTVGNKQDYFELLIDYVRHQTKYNGLTNTYSRTMNGLIDRLQGNWETLKADLLGLDANNTGMVKPDRITVFGSIQKAIDNFDKWLDDDKTKSMLLSLGDGLGKSVNSIVDALINAKDKIKWDELGQTFEKVGDAVGKIVDKITSSPEFLKFLDELPNIIEKILNSKLIEYKTDSQVAMELSKGNVVDAGVQKVSGEVGKVANYMGGGDIVIDNPDNYHSILGNWWNGLWGQYDDTNTYLSDINASTYLAQNPNLSDSDRQTIQGLIQDDSAPVYNITIQEIKANSFDEILDSIKKYQNNN